MRPDDSRLALPQVTVCSITSVNVRATVRALEACVGQIAFAECLLLTDAEVYPAHPDIRVVPIERLNSSAAYSDFLLNRLIEYVQTSHCLIVQWDGHVLNAQRWDPAFLGYDYIGASWPQFDDGHDVGNGGFSLRTKRLMEACQLPAFQQSHPEDVAIARSNRRRLEALGMCFAPRDLADRFSAERAGDLQETFGYHGVFNMPRALGARAFWQIYGELDDLATVRHDFKTILLNMARSPIGIYRASRMIIDSVCHAFRKR